MEVYTKLRFFWLFKQANTRLLMVTIFFFTALITNGCEKKSNDVKNPPLAVRIVKVKTMTLYDRVSYVGSVRSSKEIKVMAQIPGSIGSLPRTEGEIAKRGALIAKIYAPDLSARLARVQAETKRARTDHEYLCNRYQIDQKLTAAGALQQATLDASQRACQVSKQGLRVAQASLTELQANVDKTREIAPFSGRVLQWLSEPGENVWPGKPLLLFGGEELEIRVQVSEIDIHNGIKIGSKALIHLANPMKSINDRESFLSRVKEISPLAIGPGRTIEVRLSIPENAPITKHGTSVHVDFILQEKQDAVTIPDRAVKRTSSGLFAYLVDEGIAHEISIPSGITDGQSVEGGNQLKVGQWVATTNLDELSEGTHVYPIHEKGEGQ